MKYKFVGEYEVLLMDFHKVVKPGEIVEADKPIDSPLFELVEEKKSTNSTSKKDGEA